MPFCFESPPENKKDKNRKKKGDARRSTDGLLTCLCTSVIGSRASVRDIAATFEKVYGIQPKIERLGSLEELFDLMHAKKKAEPQNIYAWLPLYVPSGPRVFLFPSLSLGGWREEKKERKEKEENRKPDGVYFHT